MIFLFSNVIKLIVLRQRKAKTKLNYFKILIGKDENKNFTFMIDTDTNILESRT